MVTVVYNNVMICALEFAISPSNGFIPLLGSVFLMVQNDIFQRRAKGEFSRVHRTHSHKIKYHSVRAAYACVANAWKAAGDAGEGSPNHAVGITIVVWIHFHLYLEIHLHNITTHLISVIYVNQV